MICSDPRCLTCTPWERAEAGYFVALPVSRASRLRPRGNREMLRR